MHWIIAGVGLGIGMILAPVVLRVIVPLVVLVLILAVAGAVVFAVVVCWQAAPQLTITFVCVAGTVGAALTERYL